MKAVNGLCMVVVLSAAFAHNAFALSTSQTATQNSNRSIDKNDQNQNEADNTVPTEVENPDTTDTLDQIIGTGVEDNEEIDPDLPLLLVNVTADRRHAYVHEQILVTVEVGTPVAAFAINGGTFQVEASQVTALTQSQVNKKFDQMDYRFQKIVYALFAEKPGELEFPPITYSATLPVSYRKDLQETKSDSSEKRSKNPRLQARSKPLKIKINEPPSIQTTSGKTAQPVEGNNTDGIWLPAVEVKLSSRWQGTVAPEDNAESKTIIPAGTPVKRSVLIEIQGQHAERVPLHEQQVDEPQRQYAEQPVLKRILTAESLNGSKLLSATLIAPEVGHFLLPALAIDWWDINKKMWRTSVLEPEAFEVVAKGAVPVATQGGATTTTFTNAMQSAFQHIHSILPILTMILGLLTIALAALCLRLWQRQKQLIRDTPNTTFSTNKTPVTEAEAWRVLRKKLDRKNLSGIRQALLLWARKYSPERNFQTLEQIRLCWPALDQPLLNLEELLYSPHVNAQPGQPSNSDAEKQLKVLRKQLVNIRMQPSLRNQASGINSQRGQLKPLYRNT